MGTPRIKDRIDKVHDESNSRYELASMVVELQEEVAALTTQRDELRDDAIAMALRLYGESDDTFAPETRKVMSRWRIKVMDSYNLKHYLTGGCK